MASHKSLGKLSVLLSVLFMLLLATAVVYALAPVTDGDDTGDWGTNPTTCTIGAPNCTRFVDDLTYPEVTPRTDYYDVKSIYITNSSTDLHLRVDMWDNGGDAQNTWEPTAAGSTPALNICLDLDNNNTTGATVNAGLCDGDEAMQGVDYRIRILPDLGNFGRPATPELFQCTNPFCATPVSGASLSVGYDSEVTEGNDSDAITEIRVRLSDMGISGSCYGGGPEPCPVELGAYYDNGVTPTDDSVPNNGFATGSYGGGSPTAVSLSALSGGQTPVAALAALVAALGLLSGGMILVRRQTMR